MVMVMESVLGFSTLIPTHHAPGSGFLASPLRPSICTKIPAVSSRATMLAKQDPQETPSQIDTPQLDQSKQQKPRYSLRTRLREETEAPFRKARMFIYAGSGLSASVGAFIASLRVIAALVGVSGVQPLNETLPNVAIDLGVIAVCVGLLRLETKAGERRLERMSRGARIASLRIQDAVTRKVQSLKKLRGRTRIVLVAGTAEKVVEAMSMAEDVKQGISQSKLLIVPFITDNDDQAALRNWRMEPFAREEWKRWFNAEREVVNAKLGQSSDVLVIVVRLDGRVGARSVGAPFWPKLIEEISKLPKKDQYGKP